MVDFYVILLSENLVLADFTMDYRIVVRNEKWLILEIVCDFEKIKIGESGR